ncbi:MAG TPA: DUF3313 family protein [Candidatus Sulfomarinibacteraceae bacterium]|nr:DUF3313 family protein [Candidatus Sulfomarinibacteraceae bacterium]
MKSHRPLLAILTVLAGLGLALGAGAASEPEGLDALVPQESGFDTTLVRPGIDVSDYKRVAAEPVELEFRELVLEESEPAVGSMISKRIERIGRPKRKDVKKTQQAFDEALRDELRRSGRLEVVDEPGSGTLIVRPAVVDIISSELAAAGQRPDPDTPPILRGTIVFDLIDAETGAIQARLSERRGIDLAAGDAGDPRFAPIVDWARSAAADLVAALEGGGPS